MKKIIALTFAALLVAALVARPADAVDGQLPWTLDIAKARETAKSENKNLFILFTGSDWCVWCKQLDAEVFSQAPFVDTVSSQFVFLYLDFPNGAEAKAKVVDLAASEKLVTQYRVQGFPSVIIEGPDGMPVGRTGYQPGGADGYLKNLIALKKDAEAITTMMKTANPEVAVYAKGVAALAKHDFLDYPGYAAVLKKARDLDPDGKHGILGPILGSEERAGLIELVETNLPKPPTEPTVEQWTKVYDYLVKSKHLQGMEFCSIGFGCCLSMMKRGQHAAAKPLLQRIVKDPSLAGQPRAIEMINARIKECDEAPKGETEKPKEGGGI